MAPLKQFTISYINGGRRKETHYRIPDIEAVLNRHQPHALFVAESLLNDRTKKKMEYHGFNVEEMAFKTKEKRIWACVKNDTPYKRRKDLEKKDVAAIWLQFGSGRTKFLVCGYYREFKIIGDPDYRSNHKKQRDRFNVFLDVVAEVMVNEHKEIHLMGDFNLNTLKWRQNGSTTTGWQYQSLVDDLYTKVIQGSGFVQTVAEITRWSKKIKSILDLHFTNRPDRVGEVRITSEFRSDHAVMTLVRSKFDFPGPDAIYKRSWKKIDWDWVHETLTKDWWRTLEDIQRIEDVDEQVERVTALLNFVLDSRWPVKKISTKKNYSPWCSDQLKQEIKEKNQKFKWAKETGDSQAMEEFKKLNNKLGNKLDRAHDMYYETYIYKNVDSKQVWEYGYEYASRSTPGAPNSLIIEGRRIVDQKEIADELNKALVKKVADINSSIPKTNTDPLDFTRKHLATKIVPEVDLLLPVEYEEVDKIMRDLKNSSAAGPDQLTTLSIKKLRGRLCGIMTSIVNSSFEKKYFPRSWKISKVAPLFKGGTAEDRFNPGKYRPVGILCPMSKIIEKVIKNRLNNHLESNKLIADTQNGYRNHRGVTTALIQLTENILKKQQVGVDSATVFCDCSAAFDTIDHKMLVNKLKLYGVKSDNIDWFNSYLQGRAQYVSIGGIASSILSVLCGVVQGSILGPIIFLLVINDIIVIGDINGTVVIYIYADDTCIRLSLTGNTQHDQQKLDAVMELVQSYMDSHKLKFNFGKTEFVVVAPKTHDKHKDLVLRMNGQIVKQKKSARLLGLYITWNMDNKFYIQDMQNSLLTGLSQRLAMLSIMSERAGIKNRKQFAFGLIYSKIVFGIQLWRQCNETLKHKIQILMNKAARIVMAKETREMRVLDLFRCLKWHTLDSLMLYHDYLLYFSIERSGHPGDLKSIYEENKSHSVYKTFYDNTKGTAAVEGRIYKAPAMHPQNPISEEDPLEGMLHQGVITRRMRMGHIRRNNKSEGVVNSIRFTSFVPRSVRQYNELPREHQNAGGDEKGWKRSLRRYCMEKYLGFESDWPNYDEQNGRILPSNAELLRQGNHIVKKVNGLFIEKRPEEYPAQNHANVNWPNGPS